MGMKNIDFFCAYDFFKLKEMPRIVLVFYIQANYFDTLFFEIFAPFVKLGIIAAGKDWCEFFFIEKFCQEKNLEFGSADLRSVGI